MKHHPPLTITIQPGQRTHITQHLWWYLWLLKLKTQQSTHTEHLKQLPKDNYPVWVRPCVFHANVQCCDSWRSSWASRRSGRHSGQKCPPRPSAVGPQKDTLQSNASLLPEGSLDTQSPASDSLPRHKRGLPCWGYVKGNKTKNRRSLLAKTIPCWPDWCECASPFNLFCFLNLLGRICNLTLCRGSSASRDHREAWIYNSVF